MNQGIAQQILTTSGILTKMANDDSFLSMIAKTSEYCIAALKNGNTIFFAGNGGSAADSQHLAGELVSRFAFDRPGLPAVALTTDSSVLTAIGNDYGYERLFERQIEALSKTGDILFAISTSGNSGNIVRGVKKAKELGVKTVGMTGEQGGLLGDLADFVVSIPSASTPKIQEGHIVVGHIICGLIEESIFGGAKK